MSGGEQFVRLIDGTEVASDSEAWRHECEARSVAHMPSTQQRHEYVDAVTRKRGAEAGNALRDLAIRIRLVEVLGRPAT